MVKSIDLSGLTFGRMTVLSRAGSTRHGKVLWNVQCHCGKELTVIGTNLANGNTTSCGCKRAETLKTIKHPKKTHGLSRTSEYRAWNNIRQRCLNPKNPSYISYGARGITICEEWENDFEQFLTDMGKKPFAGAEIDRIDNDGNYEPSNCRWTSRRVNLWNRPIPNGPRKPC